MSIFYNEMLAVSVQHRRVGVVERSRFQRDTWRFVRSETRRELPSTSYEMNRAPTCRRGEL